MAIERTSPVTSLTSIQPRVSSDVISAQGGQLHSARTEKQATAHSASVKLSDMQAKLLQPTPEDINNERVEALTIAIRNGELKMDTSKIADALIRQAQDLLHSA